ncbi:MAG: formylglycine-generating enzyme family protein [bacterium]|nr:formylglycine-generating enzyme family protein [bacterium]
MSKQQPSDVSIIEPNAERVYKNDKGFWEADYGDCITMVYIPPGKFTMGSNNKYDDVLAHSVELDGYWLGKYEVTFDQYDIYCKETGKEKPGNWGWWRRVKRGNRPVMDVSWYHAADYCKWLSNKAGISFKLPTEAQWEKAARGTDGRKYPWGEQEPNKNLTNFNEDINKASPVGSYPQGTSPYGLLDMAGNVWEWCRDWYAPFSYFNTRIAQRNPTGPVDGAYRIIRGGSFLDKGWRLRCFERNYTDPSYQNTDVSFRLCQDNQ